MLMRREALDDIGLLDEPIFVYMDDVDLCQRALDGGWNVWYAADATAVHLMGAARSASHRPSRRPRRCARSTAGTPAATAGRPRGRSGPRGRRLRRPGRRLRRRSLVAPRDPPTRNRPAPTSPTCDSPWRPSCLDHDTSTITTHDHGDRSRSRTATTTRPRSTTPWPSGSSPTGPTTSIRVDPDQIPFHNREHVDYLTKAIDQHPPARRQADPRGRRRRRFARRVAGPAGRRASWASTCRPASSRSRPSGPRSAGSADRTTFVHSPIEDVRRILRRDRSTRSSATTSCTTSISTWRWPTSPALLAAPGTARCSANRCCSSPRCSGRSAYSKPVDRGSSRCTPTPPTSGRSNHDDLEIMRRHFDDVAGNRSSCCAGSRTSSSSATRCGTGSRPIDRKLLAHGPGQPALCRMIVLTSPILAA